MRKPPRRAHLIQAVTNEREKYRLDLPIPPS